MKLFPLFTALLSSQTTAVEAANNFSRAYEGGKYHTVDFGADSGDVPINLAGLYATINASIGLAAIREESDEPSEDTVKAVLEDMAERRLEGVELTTAMLFANATWAAGQWFRKPVRVERIQCFTLLSPAEKVKDVDQLAAGAKFILAKLEEEES
ncbi:MAG: hypothetical protein WC882_00435 [Candidatus Gracilibacteria bacterium]